MTSRVAAIHEGCRSSRRSASSTGQPRSYTYIAWSRVLCLSWSCVMQGERFGAYTVYECLGAGGMAIVHRATIELENDELREVALKRMLPQYASDRRFVDDFIREG